jgi:oligopeptidase B
MPVSAPVPRSLIPDPCPSCPPRAPVDLRRLTAHGDIRPDPWFWLRDRDNPAVIEYLEAENAWTGEAMGGTEWLQEALYREMLGRIQETDLSVPERVDDWWYYTRTEAGRQYPIHCRRLLSPEGPEYVLLDQNQLAAGLPYFRLGAFRPSPDHRYLAYAVDTSGDERYTLLVKDLETGELLPDRVEEVTYGVEWSNDGRSLFYLTMDAASRPSRLWRHEMGSGRAGTLVHQEDDGTFILGLSRTRSRRFLLVESASHSSAEVRVIDADRPTEPPRLLAPRAAKVEYAVEHHGDRFFILTNDGAVNFRLVEAPVAAAGRESWETVLPHREAVKLDGADAFAHHLVVYEREAATPHIRIRDLRTGEEHRIAFPEEVYSVQPARNPEFDTAVLRFTYTSPVTPLSVIDYDMDARTWTLLKRQPVLGGYDETRYRTERVFATLEDGTRVPLSLVYREPLQRDGSRPLLLSGYGSYGSNYDPAFSSNAVSLLDRGFVVGIAHVRGGEELGRPWYEHGKLLHKRNTFTDFIAAAEHLVAAGYTSADRLAISGGSAGGLLMGAVVNMRPELFAAVVAEVPFVDVVTTMLDESIPLTVIEYEEWGNPNDPVYYEYIKSYSPYDNVVEQAYPPMLVTAGLNDPRVAYWEPAKWVAKLRVMKRDSNRLLLKTNMGAGHSGASGRYDFLREVAFKYAFVIDALGLSLPRQ